MRKSRLSRIKPNKLIEHFVSGTTARTASALVGVNRKTAVYYFHRLRVVIFEHLEQQASEFLSGEIEVDGSYFGGRQNGERGRGAGGKTPVFSLLKRGGKVHTKIISDAKGETLLPIIKEKVIPEENFPLFSKECEWRFNTLKPERQLRQLKQWVKDDLCWLSGTVPIKLVI